VLAEAGIDTVSYPTLNRRRPAYAKKLWRQELADACAADAALGPHPRWPAHPHRRRPLPPDLRDALALIK
jgi:hypothetical protein